MSKIYITVITGKDVTAEGIKQAIWAVYPSFAISISAVAPPQEAQE